MYDPPSSCPEYLEIINITSSELPEREYNIENSVSRRVMFDFPDAWPVGECRLITKDKDKFYACYNEVDTALVYEAGLFALTNSGTSLTLKSVNPSVRILDQIHYSPEDHNEMFSRSKGVALERNIHLPGGNKWRSGFVQFGYRSPGFLPEWDKSEEVEVVFSSRVIYPRSSQRVASLEILLGSKEVDGRVTIDVYDLNGKLVQTIANDVPVQGGETFSWNGTTSSGQILPEGLYLFWIYYFDAKGHKRIIKKTCVLSDS